MTDPRDPDSERPAEVPTGHHGIAEELREEIAEVVEHVPKPVRWTVGKISWLVGLGILGVIVIAVVTTVLYLARRTEWVAQELSLFTNQALATRSDLVLELKDMRGNPLTGLTLVEPKVRFRGSELPPLLEAKRITLTYSAWALLTGRERSMEVRAEDPVVWLSKGADGRIRLPKWNSGPSSTAGKPVDIRVLMHRGRVMTPRGIEGVEGLELDLDLRTGNQARAHLGRLSWTRGPFHTVLQALRADATFGDSVRVDVAELRSPELALRGHAAWARKGAEKLVHLEVQRVRWGLLARVFQNGAFDVPGEGAITVDARGERAWRGDFRSRLDWNGLAAEGVGRAAWDGERLRVEPLAVHSEAGELRGWVTYVKQGWAVGGDVDRGDPARWGPLHIPGWPAGQLHGRFRYAVDTRVRGRASSTLDALLGASTLAGWRVDSATVAVAFPYQKPVHFEVDAQRRGGGFGLIADTDPAGWSGDYTVHDLPLDEWPDGRASGLRGTLHAGAGTVRADHDGMFVTGALDGTTSSWLGMQTARWQLDGVDGRLLPTPQLSATAHLRDVMYLGVHFDSAAVAFGLGDQMVALNRIEARAADTVVTTDGHARWDQAHWSLALDHARARSAQFDWVAEPQVLLAGDPHGVDFERLVGHDGDARLQIAGRWAAPGGTYDWTFRGDDLALGRLGLPLEWAVSGRADVRLDVHGVAGDPRWTFSADCAHPGTHGHAADSVHVTLAGAPGRAELREGVFTLGAGRLTGTLRVDDTRAPWPDTLTAEGVMHWLATARRWDGSFQADAVPLDRLQALVPDAQGFAGALSGRLEVKGSPARPELALQSSMAAPRWRDFVAEAMTAEAAYGDGRLTVRSVRMLHRTLTSEASGSMPLRLALGTTPVVPEDAMDWKFDIPAGDLGLLPLFVPQIASASGHFDARATVGGTARHPRLDGFAHIRDAALRLEGREEVLEKLSANLRFSESRVTLDTLQASEGVRGRVTGRGAVELHGLTMQSYRFDLLLRDFTAVEQGLYAAAFDGGFVVTNGPRVHGQTLPMVVGTVHLERAAILFDFANQSEMQRLAATTQPLFWVYRVQLDASDNLHWQPPNGDIEFSADLTVEQTVDSLLVFGEMHSLRGTYWFLSNRFSVDRADLTFDNVAGVDPLLDVEATTRIAGAIEAGLTGSVNERARTHTITAAIIGRSSKPTITLADDQLTWDQPRILRELTLGTVVGPTAFENNPLDNYVTRALNRTLSAEMSRLFQGYVSEWALERERGGLFTGAGDLVATVGVPLGRNLSVRIQRRLGGTGGEARPITGATDDLFERNLEAEYRLNRFFYVTTEYVTRRPGLGGTTTLGGTGNTDLNVNLKARWEY